MNLAACHTLASSQAAAAERWISMQLVASGRLGNHQGWEEIYGI